ncbi:MAG: amino acid adenylation domain-containing protein [Chlorobium sp.]|jgi:amino acid adenylation domain-containing protein|nr:amino acid adenylation domain-containing protein [Chlorobium sp.]
MKEGITTVENRYGVETPLHYYDISHCLHELFKKQASLNADNPAVIDGTGSLTYRVLDEEADNIAQAIVQRGINRGSFIGLCTTRSSQVISGMLGILKAGCAYVHLDPEYPSDRLGYIIDDAGISLILTQQRFTQTFSFCLPSLLLFMDCDQPESYTASIPFSPVEASVSGDPAYVIYTSGTTGKPKGVCCHHKGVVNLLDEFQQRRYLGSEDRCSWWTNLNFDVSVYEIFSSLLAGSALLIVPESVRIDGHAFMDWLHVNDITSAYLPPMMVADFLEWVERNPGKSRMRRLLTGVEPIPENLLLNIQRCVPQLTIINGYGPTETTICATLYTVNSASHHHETTPVGKAVQNMHLHLLDEAGDPVAAGETGEVYIGGVGVSRGYLNQPELNECLFISDPCYKEEGYRMYRTGDLAVFLPDGELAFVGRKDFQVKYMGYRIEPGEIEMVLKSHAAIRDAVVMLREDDPGLKKIVAYCVLEISANVSPKELQLFAGRLLPAYMIPAVFVFLKKIPMTPNGKSDRNALPPPGKESFLAGKDDGYTAPESVMERDVAAVLSGILGISAIGVDDNIFSLGAHSLMATRLCSQIRMRWNVNIPLAFVFENPTVKQIADEIVRKERIGDVPCRITASDAHRTVFPVSLIQKGLWLFQQFQEEGTIFNIPVVVYLSGAVRAQLIKKSFDFLIDRHECLRTVFEIEGEELVQRVLPAMQVELMVKDLSGCNHDTKFAELDRIRKEEGLHRFELDKGPLIKLHLVILGDSESHLFITFHHLIIDGWGASVLFRELAASYDAFSRGNMPALPDKKISFGDFCLWQLERINSARLSMQIQYWIEQLQGCSFIQNIPHDYSRPSMPSFSGARCAFSFSPEITKALNEYCLRNNCTMFMYLMTVFQIFIQRYSGRSEIVTGTTIANRNLSDTENIVGLLANSLAIRTDFSGDPKFTELLMQVRKVSLEAFDNQDVPFEIVVENVVQKRERSYHPVFQNLFIYQNTPPPFLHAGDMDFVYEEIGNETAKLDLLLNVEFRKESLFCWIEYNTCLFNADTIERVARDYIWIASHALHETGDPVSSWHFPSIPARNYYATEDKPLALSCCHYLFELQAERTPDNIALCCDDVQMTFRELNKKANHLAHLLIQRGVGPDIPVGLCLTRSVYLAVGILGILKAGGGYVPLDSQYPEERIRYMARDSGMRLAVTDEASAHVLSFDREMRLVLLDKSDAGESEHSYDNPVFRAGAENTAYIMYTSGTSGTPKGVAVPHRGVANLAVSAVNNYALKSSDRVLQFFSVSFDGSVEEIFMTLAVGATLVIRTFNAAISVTDFLFHLEKNEITVLDLPTAFWKELVHGVSRTGIKIPNSLRLVIIGGEQASVTDFQKWQKVCGGRVRIINTYGPTECSVVSVFSEPEKIHCSYDFNRGLPIGRPMDNTTLYVVDEHCCLVPFGMPGELLIGGAGVAKGYLNLSLLTEERFIDDVFQESEPKGRLYRTGDIVRSLSDGNLQFLGRKDNQVKIRGFRIEPGEIESVLNQHELIKQSVVIDLTNDQGETSLVGYFVTERNAPSSYELRHYLAQKMPEHMVPSYFVPIKKVPLLPNGKIDRSALPVPDTVVEKKATYVGPRDETEKTLVEIWQEVLGVHPIGVTDDFFELGGHSLLAVRLCSQIQEKVNKKVTLSGLFQSLTIEKLARTITDEVWVSESSPAVCIQCVDSGKSFPPLFFIHILGTGLKFCRPMVKYLSPELPVYGLSVHLHEKEHFEEFSVEELASRYVREVRRIYPQGPFLFAGISFGGLIAFEMARQMSEDGEDIGMVALIDSILPEAFHKMTGKEGAHAHREKFRSEGVSYLIRKVLERARHEGFVMREKSSHCYSKILLKYYMVRDRVDRMPVSLYEFAARLQNDDALQKYHPKIYTGKVTLFKSRERFYGVSFILDPLSGWGAFSSGGVEVIDCPGDHLGMLADPHVETLGMKLMQSIETCLHMARPIATSQTGEVVIRSVKRGESRLFRDISLRSIRESPDAFVATLDQVQHEPLTYWEQLLDFIVDSPLDTIFLACIDQRCIGFAAARIYSNDPYLTELRWMWVDRDFRGKGLGGSLLEKVIEWAQSRGSQKIDLWVSESQNSAIQLYISKGFVDTGDRGFLRPGSALHARKMIRDNADYLRHGG